MKLETRLWPDQRYRFGAKATFQAETPEELEKLRELAEQVGVEMHGSRFDVMWSWPRIERNRKKLAARRAAQQDGTGRAPAAALTSGG